jgi:hypothetical protein
VRRGWRFSVLPWILLLPLVAGRVAGANWNFTTPGDPNRSWSVGATSGGTYDDNFNATERNRQSGLRSTANLRLHAAIPLERLFVGAQYSYGVDYPHDVNLGGVDQSHSVSVSANYTVNPRLTLNLGESFISSIQPGLVLGPNNVPVTISNYGNYIYDAVGGGVNYAITPRWTAAVNANWDIWRYQNAFNGFIYNHEDYSATISALYALDARTTVGLNYQYVQNVYVHPGPKNGLDGYSDNAYLSATRRFNPRLSLTLDGGYTIYRSEDGSESTSPSGAGILAYNYNTDSTISLAIAQSLSAASVGVTRSYSAQENTSLALQVNHRLTPRLRALADLTYTYSTFTAPLAGTSVTLKPNEQALTSHFGLGYTFRDWLSVGMDYYHTELAVTASALTGIQPYSRNQISVGITLGY